MHAVMLACAYDDGYLPITGRICNPTKKKKKQPDLLLCILSSYAMTSSQMFQGKSASRPRVTPSRCEGTPDDASDCGGGSGRNSSLAASVVQCCLCRSRVDRFKKSQDILRCFE